jgi:broad specificity phosphatase PhoE
MSADQLDAEKRSVLVWARHGQNVANLTETFSHRIFDGDLTDLGRMQADDLGRRLAVSAQRVEFIACSPLRRAVQTARIVADRVDVPVGMELDELRELNVGALDGRSDPEAWRIYNDVLSAWRAGRFDVRFPNGENAFELADRLRAGLMRVLAGSDGKPSLVVAHGANLRAALSLLTGLPDPGVDLPTGGVAQFDVSDRPGYPSVRVLSWGAALPVPSGEVL